MTEPTLCEKCAAAFKVVPEGQIPMTEQDGYIEKVYNGLTAFAFGAALGIVIGVFQD